MMARGEGHELSARADVKLLVAAAKIDFGERLDGAVETVRALVPAAQVVSAARIPWAAVMQTEGGFDPAYAWAARVHDALCVLETPDGTVARGTASIIDRFLRAGKRVVALRESRFAVVTGWTLTGEDDWKNRYAVLQVQDRIGS